MTSASADAAISFDVLMGRVRTKNTGDAGTAN